MTTTALSCGNVDRSTHPKRDGVHWVEVPATPGRTDIDPLLAELDGRLLVRGTDADFAAVILRLLRKNRLADVVVGYAPAEESEASRLWGLPTGRAGIEFALDGDAGPVPLVRDDAGGVLIAYGMIEPIIGQVYCDDQHVLAGPALSMRVSPDPDAAPLPEPAADPSAAELTPAEDGLQVTVVRRGFPRKRRNVTRGRAVQASFRPTTVVCDGIAHPKPAEKWGWYRHTEDLRLVHRRRPDV